MQDFGDQRRTKIVATIGPASEAPAVVGAMIDAGMNVARIGLAHGTLDDAIARFHVVRQAALDRASVVGILIDLPGPKVRTGSFPEGGIRVANGDRILLVPGQEPSSPVAVSIDYPGLLTDCRIGDRLTFGDGNVVVEVVEEATDGLIGVVLSGGRLEGRPGVTLPADRIQLVSPTPDDLRLLDAFLELGTDMVALSFVQTADDIRRVDTPPVPEGPMVVAKIETPTAMANLGEIIDASDAVMIARGDLGLRSAIEDLPHFQKQIIRTCVQYGRPMITATQMLESMVSASTPTRAEATDVANAVLDGTSALMLSGETAIGHDPALAVATMARIAKRADAEFEGIAWGEQVRATRRAASQNDNALITDTVTSAAWQAANELNAAAIICWSESGQTVRAMARFRRRSALIGLSANPRTIRQLSLSWGVAPIEVPDAGNEQEAVERGLEIARRDGYVTSGDAVVVVSGSARAGRRVSDSLRLIRVD